MDNPADVIAASLECAGSTNIPIDHEHQTNLASTHGQPAPAAGWIRALAVRDGAIWGQGEGQTHRIAWLGLAALVPKPRVNPPRFHGVFAPNGKHRALITPAKCGKRNKRQENRKTEDCTLAKRHAAMTWTQRWKRVFNIEITTCEECAGTVKVIASIEDPALTSRSLHTFREKRKQKNSTHYPRAGHRPKVDLFGEPTRSV